MARCTGNLLELNVGGRAHVVPFREFDTTDEIDPVPRALASGWTYRGGRWEKGGVKFVHMYWPIIETFEEDQYDMADVRGKQVVDVGAFVGDSAIYFALKGAERVYTIEPYPLAYEELVRNVDLNGLRGRAIPLNLAISYVDEYVSIPPGLDVSEVPVTLFKGPGEGRAALKVRAAGLGDVVRGYGVRPDVPKMDCEGCEYDVILRDYDTVSQFEQVMFEYHAYNVGVPASRLLEVLTRWFTCEPVNDQLFKVDPNWSRKKDYYCVRRK